MTIRTVEDDRRAVADAEAALAAARANLKRTEDQRELSAAQILAIDLHTSLCRWNHTDGCGWEYEIERNGEHRWGTHSHADYLNKAEALLERFPSLDVSFTGELLRAVKEL